MSTGRVVGLSIIGVGVGIGVVGIVIEASKGKAVVPPPSPGVGPCGAACCPAGTKYLGCNGNAPLCLDASGDIIQELPCAGNCGEPCCPGSDVFVGCVANTPVCALPTQVNAQYPCPCGCSAQSLGTCQGYTPISGFQGCCPPGNPNCWSLFPPGGCPSPVAGENCEQYCLAQGSGGNWACCGGVCNCVGSCAGLALAAPYSEIVNQDPISALQSSVGII